MNINATLIAQAVVMIVFVAICWRYIYPPILSVMKEREKRISDGLEAAKKADDSLDCLLYTSPSPRDHQPSRMPSSA